MANNPLEQFFRQPKIFIKLPSQGVYNEAGSFSGDFNNIPVYSMTAMDEIIAKTPDALFSGESMVRMIQSCCPSIKNAWDVSMLDLDLIYAAIRIATYGNLINVNHTCPNCQETNEYDLDLVKVIDHFTGCSYNNNLTLSNISIRTKPVNYKRNSELQMKQYQLNKQLLQLEEQEESEERQAKVNDMFKVIAEIQSEFFIDSVESIDTGKQVVTEKTFIIEFMKNCDREIFNAIKNHIEENQKTWLIPKYSVKCTKCSNSNDITLNLDQSNFFEYA